MEAAAQPTAQPTQQSEPQSAQQSSGFSVPEQYASSGWAQNIKSPDDLWNQFANAQSLLGKRPAGIPTKDAPQEEWDKFYQSIGRPESPDKYELGKIENLPEGIDLTPYEQKMRTLAHEIGLSPEQASKAWQKYLGMELEGVEQSKKSQQERQDQLDKEFDDLSGRLFGDQFEAYSKQAQDFLKVALPDELKPIVGELSDNPRALAALVQVSKYANDQISATKQKYGAEDRLASGGQSAAQSQDEVRNALVQAKQTAASHAPFSPERKAAEAEIERLRSSLSSMLK